MNAGAKTLESALSTPVHSAAVVAHCIQPSRIAAQRRSRGTGALGATAQQPPPTTTAATTATITTATATTAAATTTACPSIASTKTIRFEQYLTVRFLLVIGTRAGAYYITRDLIIQQFNSLRVRLSAQSARASAIPQECRRHRPTASPTNTYTLRPTVSPRV